MPRAQPSVRVSNPPARPLLLFDGDCGFCRLWIERWRDAYGARVDFTPAQEAGARFPEIPAEKFNEAVQLIETDGSVHSGAPAVLRTRALGKGRRDFALFAYESLPGVAPVTEMAYGLVARHRPLFSRLSRIFWGREVARPRFAAATWLFLRLLAVVFLIAFVSFWVQLGGLVGPRGILPAQSYLDEVAQQAGAARFWLLPTLGWLFGGGVFLHVLCAAGVLLSVALFLGFAPPLCLFLLWLCYLSLLGPGQIFMNYQWDALLLEAGLLSVFLAPWRWHVGWHERPAPPPLARWLLWWLLFRLMFLSGAVKLTSGDKTWENCTALLYHYQTQPLPTWLGWWVHQLPAWLQKASCRLMFVIELGGPFLLFGPRRARLAAALSLIAFQLFIALTGNYTFFNLLTVALCLLFLDDAWWARRFPRVHRAAPEAAPARCLPRWILAPVLVFVVAFTSVQALPALKRGLVFYQWVGSLLDAVGPFRSLNNYGLFAVMTTTRPEIVIEGSADGRAWEAYEFKWKPGALARRPGFVAPHQPRLDWQLWFAALAYPRREPWIYALMQRLGENSPPVTGLLAHNPFPDPPPRYLRAVLYDYEFTTPAQRSRTGRWWRRDPLDYYFPATPMR